MNVKRWLFVGLFAVIWYFKNDHRIPDVRHGRFCDVLLFPLLPPVVSIRVLFGRHLMCQRSVD